MPNGDVPGAVFTSEVLRLGTLSDGNGEVYLSARFYLTESRTNHVSCRLWLTGADDLTLEQSWGIYAYDISRFLAELNRVHQSLNGEAELRSQFDALPRLVVAAIECQRGQLQVSGELFTGKRLPSVNDVSKGSTPGVYVAFGGFRTDQSHIPCWIQSVRELFREGRVDETPYF
jgi:hypothetical protein